MEEDFTEGLGGIGIPQYLGNQGGNSGAADYTMPVMRDMRDRGPIGQVGDDPRDPIGSINRLRQANQPIPESLQKEAFQFAGANNLDINQLAKRLGVSASDISQAAQDLGIQDQLPSSLGGTGFGEQTGLQNVLDLSLIHISEPTRPY